MFQFRLVQSPLSFTGGSKEKKKRERDLVQTNRISSQLNIPLYSFCREKKILIPIYGTRRERSEERRRGIDRKYRGAPILTSLLHIHNAAILFREYSGNLKYSRGKCPTFFSYLCNCRTCERVIRAVVILQANKEPLWRARTAIPLCTM